jgi:hypothetical protein
MFPNAGPGVGEGDCAGEAVGDGSGEGTVACAKARPQVKKAAIEPTDARISARCIIFFL